MDNPAALPWGSCTSGIMVHSVCWGIKCGMYTLWVLKDLVPGLGASGLKLGAYGWKCLRFSVWCPFLMVGCGTVLLTKPTNIRAVINRIRMRCLGCMVFRKISIIHYESEARFCSLFRSLHYLCKRPQNSHYLRQLGRATPQHPKPDFPRKSKAESFSNIP